MWLSKAYRPASLAYWVPDQWETLSQNQKPNKKDRVNEMTLWVKELDTKPSNLNLNPRTHVVETENQHLKAVLWPSCMHINKQVKSFKNNKYKIDSTWEMTAEVNCWPLTGARARAHTHTKYICQKLALKSMVFSTHIKGFIAICKSSCSGSHTPYLCGDLHLSTHTHMNIHTAIHNQK